MNTYLDINIILTLNLNLTLSILQKHSLLTQSMWSTGHGMVKVGNVRWVFCWLQSDLVAHVATERGSN